MRVSVVYCPPAPAWFTAAVRHRAVEALQGAGHDVRVSDLYADGFEPAMPLAEVAEHLEPPEHKPAVSAYCTNLQRGAALVSVYPPGGTRKAPIATGCA